jgi:hypothetical protein
MYDPCSYERLPAIPFAQEFVISQPTLHTVAINKVMFNWFIEYVMIQVNQVVVPKDFGRRFNSVNSN